jgi:zinc/manganese transport system substrate-binding protein
VVAISSCAHPRRRHALLLLVWLVAVATLSGCGGMVPTGGNRVQVLAAENEYGNIALQIGGPYVEVTSLLNSPNVDPHQYEASPSVARTLAMAGVVIENGLGYDSWMDKMLSATSVDAQETINVGTLLGRQTGSNPHIWYDPQGWTTIASAMSRGLSGVDRKHAKEYQHRADRFVRSLVPIFKLIATIRGSAHGAAVTATEPVYGYMAAALGLRMRNMDFQGAIMNENDPSPGSVVRLERDLRTHRVRILFYNRQSASPITEHMRSLASDSGVPVVGVTETMPAHTTFQAWQLGQLRQVQKALSQP